MIRLMIGAALVECDIRGERTSQSPKAADQRTDDLLWRLRRQPSEALLREAGAALADRFLDGPVGRALCEELRLPGRHAVGVEATDPAVADLPWETLIPSGRSSPLALDPDVDLYRTTARTGGPGAPAPDGPLRIVAAVAAPDDSAGELLDYERELGRILDAVEPGRRTGSRVRVLEWGSAPAIRDALDDQACHVLHVSCHARPGALLLETRTGEEDPVDAGRFLREVLPPQCGGRGGVPLIVLAGCSTALEGQSELPGLARSLLDNGAAGVLAMNNAVSDDYATELCARLYERLSGGEVPDLLTVFSDVRRELAEEPGPLPEWATPALFLADPALCVGGSGAVAEEAAQEPAEEPGRQAVILDGTARARQGFVGRRSTLRGLAGTEPRILLHGIGGVGKTSLAAELAQRFLNAVADGVVVAAGGETGADAILDQLRRTLGAHCTRNQLPETDPLRRAVIALSQPGRDWREHIAVVGEVALPLLLVLDNAEDNLDADKRLADDELAAFLQAWAEHHPVIITSRHPFPIPGVEARHLGPLPWQETRKLFWRLSGIDSLTPAEQRQVWTRLGGHPRSLEYLDALLREGTARFGDVDDRLHAALAGSRTRPGELGRRLDEADALIAQDVLLPELIARLETAPLARSLLMGAAVYRLPVDRTGLAWQVAPADSASSGEQEPPPVPDGMDEAMARLLHLGLLAPADTGYLVHRWTAGALARLAGRERLAEAHRRAAAYWGWMSGTTEEQDTYIGYVLEARYHELACGRLPEALDYTSLACHELDRSGQWVREQRLRHAALSMATPGSLEAAQCLAELGNLDIRMGRYAQAEERYRQALTAFEELGADEQAGGALHQLGLIADHRGDETEAERLYRQSMAVKERIGHLQGMAITLHQLANLARGTGDDGLAEQRYLEELAISEELDDLEGIAAAHHQIGVLAFRAKDYVKAERCTQVALTQHVRLRDRINQGNGRIALAKIALARFQHAAAQAHVRAALEDFEEIGSTRNIAESCELLAEISRDLGDLPWAETCFSRARSLFAALGEQMFLASCSRQLGAVRTVLGRVEEAVPCTLDAWHEEQRQPGATWAVEWFAVQHLELGAQAFAEVVRQHADPSTASHVEESTAAYVDFRHSDPSPTPLGSAYLKLGIAANARGDVGVARMCIKRALPLCEAAEYHEAIGKCHEDLGHANLESGLLEDAKRHYLDALATYGRLGNDTNSAIVQHQLGWVCHEQRAYTEAEEHLRASVETKRRLGNQAGVSNSTFHLGRVAQLRGDHLLAEQCYRECLAIDEAQRAWAEVALDYGELGNLRAEQGRSEEAVPFMIRALSVNQQIKSHNTARNISALRQQRAELGDESFADLLHRHFDDETVAAALTITDTLPSTGRTL